MTRTVKQIEDEDKNKAALGGEEELESIEIDKLGSETEGANTGEETGTPEETVEGLKKKLQEANEKTEREREARQAAEERAGKANGDANNARLSQLAVQEQAITSRVDGAKTKLDSVKQQLKQAKAAGDGDSEVDLQDAMAEARYELNAAVWEQGQFTKWKEQQLRQPAPSASTETSPYTAKEQAWLDDHPEFYTDKKFARLTKVLAAEALEEGHKQDSRAFFAYVEQGLRENGFLSGDGDPTSGAGNPPARKPSTSTGTPPNRSGNGANPPVNKNSKYPFLPKGYTVPKEWVQAAQEQGFDDPLEYANMRLEDEAAQRGRQ
jgi:hypothetical protein